MGKPPDFSRREEVLALRAQGLDLRQIAGKLGITYQRVQQILALAIDAKLSNANVCPSRKTQLRHALTRRCQSCGKTRMVIAKGSKTLCADCRKAHNAITREKKRELVAAGLCGNCRKPLDRGGRLCLLCHQEYMQRYR